VRSAQVTRTASGRLNRLPETRWKTTSGRAIVVPQVADAPNHRLDHAKHTHRTATSPRSGAAGPFHGRSDE